MSLLSASSEQSRWRGYEYFKAKKVSGLEKTGEDRYHAFVAGTGKEPYEVTIDLKHVRQSSCTCPHAAGRRIICKHMIAAFFTAFPQEAQDYYENILKAEEEWEEYQKELNDNLERYVHSLKKRELQELLLELLYSGPEWQLDRFIRDYIA